MQDFIGTKLISAMPMNRRDYCRYRDWDLPTNENGDDEGFLVEYIGSEHPNDDRHDGYISWSPANELRDAYQLTTRMSFGHAVEMLKGGHRVARAGWNGKGMFLMLVPAGKAHLPNGGYYESAPYILMKTADDNVVPWLASQTDVLAEDWTIIR